jgi:hypothetical protein
MDCLSYSWLCCCTRGAQRDCLVSLCAQAFPLLPSWGLGLGCVCGMEVRVRPHPHQSTPAAHCSFSHMHMHIHFPSPLFLGEWQWVSVAAMQLVVVAATLDANWDVSMECLSCRGGCTWRGVEFGPGFCAVPLPLLVPSSQLRTGVDQGA